jgi:hypothetical protein
MEMDKFWLLALGDENTAYDSVFGIMAGRHPPRSDRRVKLPILVRVGIPYYL